MKLREAIKRIEDEYDGGAGYFNLIRSGALCLASASLYGALASQGLVKTATFPLRLLGPGFARYVAIRQQRLGTLIGDVSRRSRTVMRPGPAGWHSNLALALVVADLAASMRRSYSDYRRVFRMPWRMSKADTVGIFSESVKSISAATDRSGNYVGTSTCSYSSIALAMYTASRLEKEDHSPATQAAVASYFELADTAVEAGLFDEIIAETTNATIGPIDADETQSSSRESSGFISVRRGSVSEHSFLEITAALARWTEANYPSSRSEVSGLIVKAWWMSMIRMARVGKAVTIVGVAYSAHDALQISYEALKSKGEALPADLAEGFGSGVLTAAQMAYKAGSYIVGLAENYDFNLTGTFSIPGISIKRKVGAK